MNTFKKITLLLVLIAPLLGAADTINEAQKLNNIGQITNNNFGRSVSIDSNRVAIGASLETMFEGAVYIFNETNNGWVQTHRLVASDPQPSLFGRDISLHGNRLLIGSVFADSPNVIDSGAVYVFDYDGTNWVETAKLLPNDPIPNGSFGTSVSLYGDRVAIGADSTSNTAGGAVYVFEFDGSNWSQTHKLAPNNSVSGDFFGKTLSLKSNQLLVGEQFETDNNISSGAAYMFNYNGNNWQETQKFIPPDPINQQNFGISVDLGEDYFIVGAISDDSQGSNTGAAYVYSRTSSNTWLLQQKLLKNNSATNNFFGFDVAINGDTVVVSDIPFPSNSGSAYLFKLFGNSWREISTISATDQTADDNFGLRLSISRDRIIIGAESSGDGGAAYVFNNDLIFIDGLETLN